MQDTLTEISEWLESHPQEVVILACRDFDGLTDNLHEYLVACINNIFGDMLCPRGVGRAPLAQVGGRSTIHQQHPWGHAVSLRGRKGPFGAGGGQEYDHRLPCLLGSAVHDGEIIPVLGVGALLECSL